MTTPQPVRPRRWSPLALLLAGLAGFAIGARSQSAARAATECDNPHPAWLACEDFEQGDLGWRDWFAQSPWVECNGCLDGDANPHRIHLAEDPAAAHSGRWSLHMPAAAEANFTGGALTWRDCIGEKRQGCRLRGHEELYFRTHVRLAPDHQYVHHFLAIDGTKPDRYWDADGNAGCRPDGYRWAGTTLDFNRERELFFYTYFPDMRCDSGGYCSGERARQICEGCAQKDMPCSNGPECCWGNHFASEAPVNLPRDQWVCLEIHMRLNTPGQADGEMSYWIDGLLGHSQTGMLWRHTADLQLNKAWLMHYIAGGDADQSNRVWFDDVVVSTEPIGCGPAAEPTEAPPAPMPSTIPTTPTTAPTTATSPPPPAAPDPITLPWLGADDAARE